MNKVFLYFCSLFVLSLSSCSRTYYQLEAIPQQSQVEYSEDALSADDIVIEVDYASTDLNLSVFQVDVFNDSKDTITISTDEIVLALKDIFYSEETVLDPLGKDYLIDGYLYENERLKSRKKSNTIWRTIASSLTLITLVNSPGVSTGNTLGFIAGSSYDILEERGYYNALTGSNEERIAYVEDWVLDTVKIAPGKDDSFDLIFEHGVRDGDCRLEILVNGSTYKFPFLLETIKVKR